MFLQVKMKFINTKCNEGNLTSKKVSKICGLLNFRPIVFKRMWMWKKQEEMKWTRHENHRQRPSLKESWKLISAFRQPWPADRPRKVSWWLHTCQRSARGRYRQLISPRTASDFLYFIYCIEYFFGFVKPLLAKGFYEIRTNQNKQLANSFEFCNLKTS